MFTLRNSVTRWVVCCYLVSLFALSGWAAESKPWPIDVEGFQAVEAKEHPRLFFRRSDLPALRERARTVEGKLIIERLKALLGGGESMPTHFNPVTTAYGKSGGPIRIIFRVIRTNHE